MGRKYIRAIGLEGEWDREKLLDYLRRKHAVPLWNEEFGLYFKPRLFAKRTRKTMRAWGMEPEKFLAKEALAEPHRTYANPQEREEDEVRLLGLALRENLKKEVLASLNSQ
jgi:hypothetical protein